MAVSPQTQSDAERSLKAPSVSAEMEAIFLDATGHASTHRAGPAATFEVSRIAPVAPRRALLSPTTLGAAAAVILAGLSAGAVFVSRPGPAPGPATVAQPSPLASVEPARSAPAPAIAAASLRGPYAAAAPTLRPVIAVSAPRRHARRAAAARPSHADLIVADRRLRRAYAQAVDAGVPRPILVDYRNRWNDLRHEASWRPERVRVGYDAMARDLVRMSSPPLRRRASREVRW